MASGNNYYLPSPMLRAQKENMPSTKFILVTGGVCSSLGKGVTTSATGALLRAEGFRVCSIKIDPYINIDAGLMSPFEHGEVYVLEDGGEVDLDLGNYERWMSVKLCRSHNITTGKVFSTLLEQERAGKFLGKTVQMVPHFTDEVLRRILDICAIPVSEDGRCPDVCMIELGGTIGDMESQAFVEALRRLRFSIPPEDFCLLHTTYLPVFGGSQKTKPTQHSSRALLSQGLQPDFIIARSETPLDPDTKDKLSHLVGVQTCDIVSAPNVDCLYDIPVQFVKEGLLKRLLHKLRLKPQVPPLGVPDKETFEMFSRNLRDPSNPVVRIAFVGKYVKGGSDAYFSVLQCFEHCCISLRVKLDIVYIDAEDLEGDSKEEGLSLLRESDGIFVPGGFGLRGVNGMCAAIQVARENDIPYFGVCLGMQVAVIETARHVIGWEDANSEEFAPECAHQIVRLMDSDRSELGASMHLGAREVHIVEKDSIMNTIYSNQSTVIERHRHRYEINATYLDELRKSGVRIAAVTDPNFGSDCRVEAIEIPSKRFFLAVQFHPEFVSSPLDPSPPYLAFVAACAKVEFPWPNELHSRRTNIMH